MNRQLHLNSERILLAIKVNQIQTSKKQDRVVCARYSWNPRNINKCSGFTLMQVAIALMVLGILWSVGLKAMEVIDLRRIQKLAADFKNVQQAISEYQGKYRALPGDDPTIGSTNSHLNGANTCTVTIADGCKPGNGIIDGKWNDSTASSESFIFWQHVRLAGYSSGDVDITTTDYPEINVVGGRIGITNQDLTPVAGLKGAHIICSDSIPGDYAKEVDRAIDDGNTDSGFMRVTLAGTAKGGTAIAANLIIEHDLYLVCMGV